MTRMHARLRDVALNIGLAALYAVTARAGLAFDAVSGFATLVWPPTGIAIAALLLFGNRLWPGVFLGAAIANLFTGAPVLAALGIAIGNTLEGLVGASLLSKTPRFELTLENGPSVLALLLVAIIAPILSASIGVISLYLGHVIQESHVRATLTAWWIGDMVGAILVTPVILIWSRPRKAPFPHRWWELAALTAALIVVSLMTFFGDHVPLFSTPFHQTNILLAALIWAVMRFGQRGAATAALGVSAMAVAATTVGRGPFVQEVLSAGLLSLQTFVAIIAATLLVFGAVTAERMSAIHDATRARDEAAQANLAKSEFLAVMSHELRTPLNAIAGYAELLRDGVYGSLNAQEVEAVQRIQKNEKQLLTLIDEVLGFVSAEKGELKVETVDIPVAAAFDAVEPLIQPDVERKHLEVKRDLGAPLMVHADPTSLKQILMSLLSNASKYTQDGGMITLGADREGASVRIWVRDTGAGISKTELHRVFEPFFQAERGRTRRYSGVGLGLTIARDLARRMDGELTIASEVGSGTTASIRLPAA